MAARGLRLIDIGANLTDPVYHGLYRGKQVHPADFDAVLKRGFDVGLTKSLKCECVRRYPLTIFVKVVVTGGKLDECKHALELARANDCLYCTVGCHPTRCNEFERTKGTTPEGYMKDLLQLAGENKGKVVAIGECGLDYDRLQFCEKAMQLKYFEKQLDLVEATGLPMFLHCRNAFGDFFDIMTRNRAKYKGGVVHSFTGTVEEALKTVDMGFYIGINGCSLKTEENLAAVKAVPSDRILLETDCPWCEIRSTHASYKHVRTHFEAKKKEKWEPGFGVKSRNEPRNILQVLEVVSAVKGQDQYELAEQIYANTCQLFGW